MKVNKISNEEILRKAIEKAINDGYNLNIWELYRTELNTKDMIYSVLFSHDFAKAFWGMENSCCIRHGDTLETDDNGEAYCRVCCDDENEPSHTITGWQFHLQQMVLEEDPIKYLEKFI